MATSALEEYPELRFTRSSLTIHLAVASSIVVVSQVLAWLVQILATKLIGTPIFQPGLSLGVLLILALAAFVIRRQRVDETTLVISSEGIWMTEVMPTRLPWTSVSDIILAGEYGSVRWIHLTLHDLDVQRQDPASEQEPRVFQLMVPTMKHVDTGELFEILNRYRKAFGPTEHEEPNDRAKPGFRSECWTGARD
jgi:uncharacterized membrane protein (DUF485 family)